MGKEKVRKASEGKDRGRDGWKEMMRKGDEEGTGGRRR